MNIVYYKVTLYNRILNTKHRHTPTQIKTHKYINTYIKTHTLLTLLTLQACVTFTASCLLKSQYWDDRSSIERLVYMYICIYVWRGGGGG
ncbi:hypothetical protein B484DRAFT_268378 [Ochromonadaceae sp. CCMP2298]|nr:hypothetical protein B484DRAFT_268378 [Ochromonadaceae sp. CCMP2298]